MNAKFLIFLSLALISCGCQPFFRAGFFHISAGDYAHLQAAEEFSRQGRYDEAIDEYRAHMNERLTSSHRPEWENPYFYLVLIGDIQLGQGKVDEAIKSYLEADFHRVDAHLMADRFRGVALWYEKNGDLGAAVKVLSEQRQRDPLLFDAMLDRISKEMTRQEDLRQHAIATGEHPAASAPAHAP